MDPHCDQNCNETNRDALLQGRICLWLTVFCKTYCPLITIQVPTYTSVVLRRGSVASWPF